MFYTIVVCFLCTYRLLYSALTAGFDLRDTSPATSRRRDRHPPSSTFIVLSPYRSSLFPKSCRFDRDSRSRGDPGLSIFFFFFVFCIAPRGICISVNHCWIICICDVERVNLYIYLLIFLHYFFLCSVAGRSLRGEDRAIASCPSCWVKCLLLPV